MHVGKLVSKTNILLVLVLILALFLRVYKLDHLVGFDADQEYAANFAYNVVNVYPIQLIGQGLSAQGLFMGPGFFYFLTPFFMLANLNPIGGYIGSSLLGVFTVLVYFLTFKDVFGKKSGLIASFLAAVTTPKIIGDWSMAPSYSSELSVLLSWYCMYKYWKKDYKYLILLGFLFGFYTSFHPVLFPLVLVFAGIVTIKRNIPPVKIIILSVIALLAAVSPLILFEYLHQFLEVKVLLSGSNSTHIAKGLNTIPSYIYFLFTYPAITFGVDFNNLTKILGAITFYAGSIYYLVNKSGFWKERFHLWFIFFTIIIVSVYYYLLPLNSPDYYYLSIGVTFFIYGCATLGLVWGKKTLSRLVLIVILALITFVNLNTLQSRWNRNSISLYDKEAVVKEIAKRTKSKDFNVSVIGDPGWQSGFTYLFKIHDEVPNPKSPSSPNYIIAVPASVVDRHMDFLSGDVGLILPEN